MSPDVQTQPLRLAAYALIGGFIVHNGDHMRRGLDDLHEPVTWGGTFALVLVSVALTLVFTEHRLGPWAAAATELRSIRARAQ